MSSASQEKLQEITEWTYHSIHDTLDGILHLLIACCLQCTC